MAAVISQMPITMITSDAPMPKSEYEIQNKLDRSTYKFIGTLNE